MKIFSSALLILFSVITSLYAEVTSSSWHTEKSQHFIVYSQQASDSSTREVSDKAEDYYNSIVDELGYRRFDFWSWDNRAKIYLYQNKEDFLKDTQRASWAGAVVSVHNRTIKSYVGQNGFVDSILPHEMAHIIFREFVGQNISLPLWIDEGVACSQEKTYLFGRIQAAKGLAISNTYIQFDKLFEIYSLENVQPQNFYSQSASMIVFLIRQYGKERFLEFSRKIRDGIGWKKSLFDVYRFTDTADMERSWKNFLLN